MTLEKEKLRKYYKFKRAALSEKERAEYAIQIRGMCAHWLSTRPELIHFHLFLPIVQLHEIDTYIIKDLLESAHKIVYTSVLGLGLEMQTVQLEIDSKYTVGRLGVPLPVAASKVDSKILDVVFVPLLAFDETGNRIGFGKGYYDEFLRHLSQDVLKVGLSYFLPEQKITEENHDVRLDFCITPTRIFNF